MDLSEAAKNVQTKVPVMEVLTGMFRRQERRRMRSRTERRGSASDTGTRSNPMRNAVPRCDEEVPEPTTREKTNPQKEICPEYSGHISIIAGRSVISHGRNVPSSNWPGSYRRWKP